MSDQIPGTLLYVKSIGERAVGLVILEDDGSHTTYSISRQDYEALGAPAAKSVLDPHTLDEVKRLATLRSAYLAAIRILEYGDNNRRTLMQKLQKRGFSHAVAETITLRMVDLGYVNEEQFALRQVVLCAKKGWSRKRTFAHLISHGFPSSIVCEALDIAEGAGDADFTENRRRFIEKKKEAGLSGPALQNALWRAGF